MMIYPSMDELMKNVDSRYTLVIATSKRARELAEGTASPLVSTKSEKAVSIAINEIAEGKIRIVKEAE